MQKAFLPCFPFCFAWVTSEAQQRRFKWTPHLRSSCWWFPHTQLGSASLPPGIQQSGVLQQSGKIHTLPWFGVCHFSDFWKKKIRTVNCTRLFSVFKYQYFLLGVALHQLRWQEHPTSNGLLAAWPEHTLLVWFREGFLCLFLAWHPWNEEQRLPAALFIYFNELPLASSCLHHKDFRLPQSTRKHAANCYEAETWTCQISDPHESR